MKIRESDDEVHTSSTEFPNKKCENGKTISIHIKKKKRNTNKKEKLVLTIIDSTVFMFCVSSFHGIHLNRERGK